MALGRLVNWVLDVAKDLVDLCKYPATKTPYDRSIITSPLTPPQQGPTRPAPHGQFASSGLSLAADGAALN